MAERRMFAKSVIGSARFLRMPPSSRLLYYDLGMAADDDGVVEAFSVMRMTGAVEDDLKVLVTKGFVSVLNEDLVSYILDWSKNNQIRKDRYQPSIYQNLLLQIEAVDQVVTDGQPDGNQRLTQYREVKVRSDQDRVGEKEAADKPPTRTSDNNFDRFWQAYPRKVGKGAAQKAFSKIREPLDVLLAALEQQKYGDQWTRDGGRYIPNPATWLNQERWQDEVSPPSGAKLGQGVQRHDAPLSDLERQAVARMLGKQLPT